MMNSIVLRITNIKKSVVAYPTFITNDSVNTDISSIQLLQRKLTCIGEKPSMYPSDAFLDSELNRFIASNPADPARAIVVGFNDPYFTLKGAVKRKF